MSGPSCSDGPAGPSIPSWFPELIPTDKQKGKAIRVYIYLMRGSSTTRAAEKSKTLAVRLGYTFPTNSTVH